jgi:glucose-1-phosphate adenylyltransferase
MDVRQMATFHRQCGAEVTIAAVRVPIAQASSYGVMTTGPGGELQEFREKPGAPSPIPGDPGHAYASMGNYLFDPEVLVELLERAHRNGGTDFGRDIMPLLPPRKCGWAYDFATNEVPGMHPHEERGYWRDLGTIEAYRQAQREVLGPRPRFNLVNPEWPIRRRGYPMPETARYATREAELGRPVASRPFDPFGTRAGIAHPAGVAVLRTRFGVACAK